MLAGALLFLSVLQAPSAPGDRPARDTLRFYAVGDLNLGRALIERRGWRIAVFSVTRAFNPAPRRFFSHQGSRYIAWADSGWLYPAIRRIKAQGGADLVVVSIHAGKELADSADWALRQFLRGAIDAGADLCLGHHPHVLQPVEWYRGRPIAYSMGNFIFEQTSPWTRLSAIFKFIVTPDGAMTADLIP